ncbi:MAG TPA: putative Ig domain-containing protein [Woeseiaceae bacterium]|nr:putative Ig domain-containing protein [Woeseiaceae bacterium]
MTARQRQFAGAVPAALSLIAALALGGCGGGGSPDADSATGNNPPVISGNPPPSVVVGQPYDFTPTASDADGDALTFSIQGKPAWATFAAATGALTGTPEAGDVGPYGGITISASDGSASDELGFSINVTQMGEGSVSLSWQAPTQNTDGTALTDLAGYKIYYGTEQGNYTEEVRLDNPSLTTYLVENLSPNTWYFVATSFNDDGIESNFSGVASTTVN